MKNYDVLIELRKNVDERLKKYLPGIILPRLAVFLIGLNLYVVYLFSTMPSMNDLLPVVYMCLPLALLVTLLFGGQNVVNTTSKIIASEYLRRDKRIVTKLRKVPQNERPKILDGLI